MAETTNGNIVGKKLEKRYRTIPKAVAELKAEDSDMPISAYHLRQMVKEGILPHHMIGKRIIVAVEDVKRLYDGDYDSGR